jgi:hypothetical protein
MKAKELEKHLKVIKDFQAKEAALTKALQPFIECPIITYADDLMGAYIGLIEKILGDENDSISWFVYDNNFGTNEMNYNGIKVKNASDLLKAMEVLNEQSKEK